MRRPLRDNAGLWVRGRTGPCRLSSPDTKKALKQIVSRLSGLVQNANFDTNATLSPKCCNLACDAIFCPECCNTTSQNAASFCQESRRGTDRGWRRTGSFLRQAFHVFLLHAGPERFVCFVQPVLLIDEVQIRAALRVGGNFFFFFFPCESGIQNQVVI